MFHGAPLESLCSGEPDSTLFEDTCPDYNGEYKANLWSRFNRGAGRRERRWSSSSLCCGHKKTKKVPPPDTVRLVSCLEQYMGIGFLAGGTFAQLQGWRGSALPSFS
jgi:hypothetical protein